MDVDAAKLEGHNVLFRALPGQEPVLESTAKTNTIPIDSMFEDEPMEEKNGTDKLLEDLEQMLKSDKPDFRIGNIFENSDRLVQSNMKNLLDEPDDLSEEFHAEPDVSIKVKTSQFKPFMFDKHMSKDGQVYQPLFLAPNVQPANFQMANPLFYQMPPHLGPLRFQDPVIEKKFVGGFPEAPENLIMKNLLKPCWVIKVGDLVLEHKNSFDLFNFLDSNINKNFSLAKYWITDLETDIHFKPFIIYENLKEMMPTMIETLNEIQAMRMYPPFESNVYGFGMYGMNPGVDLAKPVMSDVFKKEGLANKVKN